MTETIKRTPRRLRVLLVGLLAVLTLTFSGGAVAWADHVDFGENGAVHNGQPQEFSTDELGFNWNNNIP